MFRGITNGIFQIYFTYIDIYRNIEIYRYIDILHFIHSVLDENVTTLTTIYNSPRTDFPKYFLIKKRSMQHPFPV